ncbi:MAG: alanine dehydrogenase [Bacteroidia bacterium]|nr:alanine dehydrogenase [Bacteroidia bacterium]
MKLGLIREYKNPPDKRVVLTPQQCYSLQNKFNELKIIVEPSPNRVFADIEYSSLGIEVSENLSECDILLGIKEVPHEKLLPDKTYMFFSHTIKKQEHNRNMLKKIIANKIRLIDYECLHNESGRRILGFGKYAGIVGTYEILRAMGIKYNLFNWQSPSLFLNYDELKVKISKDIDLIKKNRNKIVLTGSGRVISGSEELLGFLKIKKVSPQSFVSDIFDETVYTLLDIEDMYEHKDTIAFTHEHFYLNHSMYGSKFKPYTKIADIMINGVYWDKNIARHFELNDTKSPDFKIKLIADISCDINGSVPITVKETTIEKPVFGWNSQSQQICEPYTQTSIDIMSISNLPTELPADASEGFGEEFIKFVLPDLFKKNSRMIEEATICCDGTLTKRYNYLQDFIS